MAETNKNKGRPRKNPTKEQLETIQQFCNYMSSDRGSFQFAKKITSSIKDLNVIANDLAVSGQYSPIFSEQLEQAIGFSSQSASTQDLQEWMQHPSLHSLELRDLSHYLENVSLQYGRAVSLISDIKSYNYDLRCATQGLQDSVDSQEFKNSYHKVMSVLRKLNIPYQIKKLDGKVAKDGIAFVWFTKNADTIDLLDLPSDYCYITAPWTYGYLFALDLTYFDRFAYQEVQVPELWNAYKVFCEKRKNLSSGERIEPYQYYPISPFDGWCSVFDNNRPIKIPPMIGAAGPAIDSLGYRDLIKQKALVDLWRVLAFKIPINNTTGKMNVTYKEASSIVDTIRSVLPENFVAFASPFDTESPINADQTSVMEGLENISNESFYDYSAVPNALFNNTDLKSAAALKLATNTLFAYASSGMYASMQNLVNWIIRIECGTKFDWHIVFHGNKLYEDEEKSDALKMFTSANAPVSYVMSHFGIEPFDVENMYIIENALGIKNKMKPLQLGNSPNAADEGGRPKIEDISKKSESSDLQENSGSEL